MVHKRGTTIETLASGIPLYFDGVVPLHNNNFTPCITIKVLKVLGSTVLILVLVRGIYIYTPRTVVPFLLDKT